MPTKAQSSLYLLSHLLICHTENVTLGGYEGHVGVAERMRKTSELTRETQQLQDGAFPSVF